LEIKIDYFSTTFPLQCDSDDSVRLRVDEMVMLIATYLNVKNFEIEYKSTAQNNFRYQVYLGEHIILRLDGPLNRYYQRTCNLEMKGQGCRDFENRNKEKTWLNLILFMVQLNCAFKRIDIAIDDYDGDIVNLKWLYDKVITKEQYVSIFKSKPKPIGTVKTGLTLQFGSNMSNTELVIYDKKAERAKKKDSYDGDYWTRYELRFRDENADAVAYKLASLYESKDKTVGAKLQVFACEQLYRVLDIKEDNKYSKHDQNKANTDKLWLDFLDNVEKGTLEILINKDPSVEEFKKMALPFWHMYNLLLYLESGRKLFVYDMESHKQMYDYMTNYSKHRFQRLNIYLHQLNIKTVDDDELQELKNEFKGIIEDEELPF